MNSRISKETDKETKTLDEAQETRRSGVEEIKKLKEKERKEERLSLKVNMMVIL
jgi:hypothetical protein